MAAENLLHFRIASVKQENPLAKTYELEPLQSKKLNYKAGQFLTFIIDTGKEQLRRSYSILSLPGESLKITVKKVDNGIISRFILQHWKEGELITSLYPAGKFTLEPQSAIQRDVFCFAAGSGIIPLLPQIRMLLKAESQSIIHLVYSNRNESDALFLEEIEALTRDFKALNLINLFSEPLYRKKEHGRLSNLSAEAIINSALVYSKTNAVFLLCGPFAYMRMLHFTIGSMHFNKRHIRRENYLPEIMRPMHVDEQCFPATNITIQLYGEIKMVHVPVGVSILDAALKQNIELPYSCKGGICGNCAAICKSGQVFMSINEVLTEDDMQAGWVLTCTGFPKSDGTVIQFLRD